MDLLRFVYSFNVGVELMIPGFERPVTVRMYIAAFNGDKPALHDMLNIKTGNCSYGCHLCCYNTSNNSVVYDERKHRLRDFNMQVQAQRVVAHTRKVVHSGMAHTLTPIEKQANTSAKEFLDKWGLKDSLPAFYNAPIGFPTEYLSLAFIRDQFHDLSGILAAILGDSLQMINAIGKMADSPFKNSINRINEATSTKRVNRHPPFMSHVDFWTFNKGVADVILRTGHFDSNTGSTGTSAGMRSSWVKGMLDKLLVAIGDDGSIVPDGEDFTYKLHVKGVKSKTDKSKYDVAPYDIEVKVCNPAGVICSALYAGLDLYYELQRDRWTEDLIKHAQEKVRRVQTLHTTLHHNMVHMCRTSKGPKRLYSVSYLLTLTININ